MCIRDRTQASDILYCWKKIAETRQSIASLRYDFEDVFQQTMSSRGAMWTTSICEVLHNIDSNLYTRFLNYSKLQFYTGFQIKNMGGIRTIFLNVLFKAVWKYMTIFWRSAFKNELIMFNSSEEFEGKRISAFVKLLNSTTISS